MSDSCCVRRPEEPSADQVCLITGSASGIGRGTALAYAALNYNLVLVDEQADKLKETAEMCLEKSPKRNKPLELVIDLSLGEQIVKSAIERTLKHFGRLDVLVNNAGITAPTKFDEPDCLELYHKIIATNMHAVVYLCLAAYESLKKTKGSIVMVSSCLDDRPGNYRFAYCMSKAAVTMLTKCLANDFAPNVRVNCVSPGPIASSILDDMGINLNERKELAEKTTLVKRIGKPEEVAKMIVYLSSKDDAAFITGSRVLVDGGYNIRPTEINPQLRKQNISGIKLRGASFLMHQVYDDEMTFKLVEAASKVSGLPVEVCLEEFGKHFLIYCQKNGYDQILRVLGSNLHDFLTNLDNLHDHLASIYPGMRAPSFRVTRNINKNQPEPAREPTEEAGCEQPGANNSSDDSLTGSMYLHYYSDRAGLSPIVKGLVMAVAREFFQTNIQVTELIDNDQHQVTNMDDHVVLKIDKLPASSDEQELKQREQLHRDQSTSGQPEVRQMEPMDSERIKRNAKRSNQRGAQKQMLNIYDSLSINSKDSLVNSEIMMQTFPFHVIFDHSFNLVQVGQSLLRVTSLYWQRNLNLNPNPNPNPNPNQEEAGSEENSIKFSDLFKIIRPKIEFTFDAIADHTNQVFVVKSKPLVLNSDYNNYKRSSSSSSTASTNGSSSPSRRAATPPAKQPRVSPLRPLVCPMDRLALEARRKSSNLQPSLESNSIPRPEVELPGSRDPDHGGSKEQEQHAVDNLNEDLNEQNYISLRLKGQMIILLGGKLCLFLCSPRVDHLDQLFECGVRMSDFALHDRARELMLMSHTHKEDRETVKKLDQASNDLKKMDTKLRLENKRTNEVLHNIFPAKIASLLSHGLKVESESFDLVTCLYSDIIGFTKMCGSENVRPIDIVRLLNKLYLQFDNLTTIHGVFKVETIGDAYVIVGGLPEPVEDHADRCVKMGLDMVKVIKTVVSPADNQPIQMRIGIHSGPVMAGIVGIRVPRYSLFGNTTTLANQLETHGVGGKIHISDFTFKNLVRRDRFVIEDNENQIGSIPFKTYFVTDYMRDEIERAKYEKFLQEQLTKDSELLLGNELQLVDDNLQPIETIKQRPPAPRVKCSASLDFEPSSTMQQSFELEAGKTGPIKSLRASVIRELTLPLRSGQKMREPIIAEEACPAAGSERGFGQAFGEKLGVSGESHLDKLITIDIEGSPGELAPGKTIGNNLADIYAEQLERVSGRLSCSIISDAMKQIARANSNFANQQAMNESRIILLELGSARLELKLKLRFRLNNTNKDSGENKNESNSPASNDSSSVIQIEQLQADGERQATGECISLVGKGLQLDWGPGGQFSGRFADTVAGDQSIAVDRSIFLERVLDVLVEKLQSNGLGDVELAANHNPALSPSLVAPGVGGASAAAGAEERAAIKDQSAPAGARGPGRALARRAAAQQTRLGEPKNSGGRHIINEMMSDQVKKLKRSDTLKRQKMNKQDSAAAAAAAASDQGKQFELNNATGSIAGYGGSIRFAHPTRSLGNGLHESKSKGAPIEEEEEAAIIEDNSDEISDSDTDLWFRKEAGPTVATLGPADLERKEAASADPQPRRAQGLRHSIANIISEFGQQVVTTSKKTSSRFNLNLPKLFANNSPFSSPIRRPSSSNSGASFPKSPTIRGPVGDDGFNNNNKVSKIKQDSNRKQSSRSQSSGTTSTGRSSASKEAGVGTLYDYSTGSNSRKSNGSSGGHGCSCLGGSNSTQSFNSKMADVK